MNTAQKPNHEEIARAMKQFAKQGGTIVKLPAQRASALSVIGNEKYNQYEAISRLVNL